MGYEYRNKHFNEFWAVRKRNPPPTKQHLNLEFLDCENAKNISKMALCAGTARKKHQKGTQGKKVHKCRYGSFRICSSLYFKGIIKKNLYFFFFFVFLILNIL